MYVQHVDILLSFDDQPSTYTIQENIADVEAPFRDHRKLQPAVLNLHDMEYEPVAILNGAYGDGTEPPAAKTIVCR